MNEIISKYISKIKEKIVEAVDEMYDEKTYPETAIERILLLETLEAVYGIDLSALKLLEKTN